MKTVVLSLGGSAIIPDDINLSFLKEFKTMILNFVEKGNKVVIVCGGGSIARTYITSLQELTEVSDSDLDWMGILATRINAQLVKIMFGELAYEKVIHDPTLPLDTDKPIIVGSGWKPGFSTDMGATLLAENVGATELLNISNIDYVYDGDPKKNPDAKPLKTISWDDFFVLVGDSWKPGLNMPYDPIASREAKRIGLTVNIVNMDIKNIKKCLEGEEFIGTIIS